MSDRNNVTNSVTPDHVTPFVTPPHTTPHHTTKNTSSRGMALGFDAAADLSGVIVSIRPDWARDVVYDAVKADDRPWRTVVAGSIRGALDPDTRHPNGLRYVNPAGPSTAPQLPTVAEALNPDLDDHGFRVGACPVCRRGGAA